MSILGAILLSVLGAGIKRVSENRYDERRKDARDEVMNRVLARTDNLSDASRSAFNDRLALAEPAASSAAQDAAEADRAEELVGAVQTDTPADVGISGSAPDVVQSEIAQKMLEAFKSGTEQAKATARRDSYGDSWMQQSHNDAATARDLAVNANFANNIFGLMPHQQDIAENRVRPGFGSTLGDIMMGAGSFMGSRAGVGGTGSGRIFNRTRLTGGSGNDWLP